MGCLSCEAGTFEFLFSKDDFSIGKCSSCELVQVTNVPTPTELDKLYDKHFYDDFYKDWTIDSRQKRYAYANFSNKLDEIEKRRKAKGKMLDVGCAFGFFLDVGKKRGWDTYGVEVSKYAADYARESLGLKVVSEPLVESKFPKGYFDVITMWNVIAHFPNPRQVFQYCSEILKDDGILVVSAANVESSLARIRGSEWRIWLPPFHLTYFSETSLKNMFRMCNLEIFEIRAAFPYEKMLRKIGLARLLETLKVSDKMILYAKKRSARGEKRENGVRNGA